MTLHRRKQRPLLEDQRFEPLRAARRCSEGMSQKASLQTRKLSAKAELSTLMTVETPLMTGTDEGPMSHKVVFL